MLIKISQWRRMLAAALALALLFLGGWSADRWLVDPWPAKIEFREDLPLCFTPDGRSFVFANLGRLSFRDCATGHELFSWILPDPEDLKIVVAGAFSPDGQTFAAAIRRNNVPAEVALIDVASGRIKATGMARYPQVDEFGFTPDGAALRMSTADTSGWRELVSFNPTTAATEFTFLPAPPRPASGVASSPDGRFLVSIDRKGGPITLHEVGTATDRPGPVAIGLTSAGATGGVGFSPDCRTLAIGRTNGKIDLWDIPGHRLVKSLSAHGPDCASLSIRFAPDGRTLTSIARFFDPPGIDLLRICRDIYQTVMSGGIRPAPRTDLVVLDLATGKPLTRSANSYYLYYSPDGRTIATKDNDGHVRLRDLPGD